eukprot:g16394.t1
MASSSAKTAHGQTRPEQDPMDVLLAELLSSSLSSCGGEGAGRSRRRGDDLGDNIAKPNQPKMGSRQVGRHVEDHDPWKALSDQVNDEISRQIFDDLDEQLDAQMMAELEKCQEEQSRRMDEELDRQIQEQLDAMLDASLGSELRNTEQDGYEYYSDDDEYSSDDEEYELENLPCLHGVKDEDVFGGFSGHLCLAWRVSSPCLDPTDTEYSCEEVDYINGSIWLSGCDITDDDVDGGHLASCLDNVGRELILALSLSFNDLTTLPAGIFEGLTSLEILYLPENALTTLPAGIFEGLTALRSLSLSENAFTTLPAGIFEGLIALEQLNLDGNDLECLPFIPNALEELDDDVTRSTDGLHVDAYGEECGCSAADGTNVCGEEICTPGPFGYTCDPGVLSPAPVLPATTAPLASTTAPIASTTAPVLPATPAPIASTTAPVLPATTAPRASTTAPVFLATTAPVLLATTAPAPATTAPEGTPPAPTPASDSTPIVAGVVSAVAGAALIALGVFVKRQRASKQKTCRPPSDDGDNLQQEADVNEDRGIKTRSARAPPDGALPAEHIGAGLAKESSETATSFATVSTANMSTAEQEEVAQFRQRQRAADAATVAGGPTQEGEALVGGTAASSSASRRSSGSDVGLGQAVLAAAQELARSCQVPGVSEAAGVLCVMANLFADSRDIDQASKSRLRQCRSIVLALTRADKVVAKGGDTMGEAARVLLEDVHDAIFDLVELIKTFQSKNKLSKLLLSTLFKRRQDELDAVVDRAIMRLQLGLQLQTGQDVSTVKDDVSAVKDNFDSVREGIDLYQRSMAEATSESVAEARRTRRQRKLDQVEIPEEHLFITDDLLGKGGFGEVYLADYNGHNAAAKVLYIGHDLGALDANQKQRETRQRRAFIRELEAMIRLRSPNTVNVFGAVTCLPDRMVLVMELLPNGDLLTLLNKSKKPLPEKQARRIIGDICAGMAFLHSKNTVHGDLKSANVLLDSDDRAKIADFGTSRWTQSTNTTGLATYTTKSNQNTQMSIAWSAPEVLESEGSSYESDVYSFGIVVWEVISRELPWAKKTRPRDILTAVWRGDRPSFPVDAPADIADIAKACWCAEPKERTTFSAILEGMKAGEWSDE